MLEVGGKKLIVDRSVELTFEQRQRIPASLETSAGFTYSNYNLRLFKTYRKLAASKDGCGREGFHPIRVKKLNF